MEKERFHPTRSRQDNNADKDVILVSSSKASRPHSAPGNPSAAARLSPPGNNYPGGDPYSQQTDKRPRAQSPSVSKLFPHMGGRLVRRPMTPREVPFVPKVNQDLHPGERSVQEPVRKVSPGYPGLHRGQNTSIDTLEDQEHRQRHLPHFSPRNDGRRSTPYSRNSGQSPTPIAIPPPLPNAPLPNHKPVSSTYRRSYPGVNGCLVPGHGNPSDRRAIHADNRHDNGSDARPYRESDPVRKHRNGTAFNMQKRIPKDARVIQFGPHCEKPRTAQSPERTKNVTKQVISTYKGGSGAVTKGKTRVTTMPKLRSVPPPSASYYNIPLTKEESKANKSLNGKNCVVTGPSGVEGKVSALEIDRDQAEQAGLQKGVSTNSRPQEQEVVNLVEQHEHDREVEEAACSVKRRSSGGQSLPFQRPARKRPREETEPKMQSVRKVVVQDVDAVENSIARHETARVPEPQSSISRPATIELEGSGSGERAAAREKLEVHDVDSDINTTTSHATGRGVISQNRPAHRPRREDSIAPPSNSQQRTLYELDSIRVVLDGHLHESKAVLPLAWYGLCDDDLKQLLDSHSSTRDKIPKKLNLQCNNLSTFGNELSRKLFEWNVNALDISRNILKECERSIVVCTQLRFLNLSRNKLSSLPLALSELSNLEVLDVSHNLLEKVPEGFGKLKNLEVLNLSSNHLTEFSKDWVEEGSMLWVVDISRNVEFEQLPGCSRHLRSLVDFKYSGTRFAKSLRKSDYKLSPAKLIKEVAGLSSTQLLERKTVGRARAPKDRPEVHQVPD